jgi:hypothetical protein
MRFYAPIAKVDAQERMVWGYASTEAEDDQGEIITRDALAAALGDYLKFANIREMHQMSAVGVAEEAGVDDRGLYVGARIVDPRAWDKVTSGVYKGFSVGGKVKARDPRDRSVITASFKCPSIVRPCRPAAPGLQQSPSVIALRQSWTWSSAAWLAIAFDAGPVAAGGPAGSILSFHAATIRSLICCSSPAV